MVPLFTFNYAVFCRLYLYKKKKYEAGWPSVDEAILKLVAILLPLLPKCCGYSHDLPCPSLTGQMITNQYFFDGNLSPL